MVDNVNFSFTEREKEVIEFMKLGYINSLYDGLLSICTARGKLSEEKMISRIERMTAIRKSYTTIVQADGFPMSGGKDDYKTTEFMLFTNLLQTDILNSPNKRTRNI